jgi:hypothetical protein
MLQQVMKHNELRFQNLWKNNKLRKPIMWSFWCEFYFHNFDIIIIIIIIILLIFKKVH